MNLRVAGELLHTYVLEVFAVRPGTADKVPNFAELVMSRHGAFIMGSDFLIDGGATASFFYGSLKPTK